MSPKRVYAATFLSLCCLFALDAPGQTPPSRSATDWEEINFPFNSATLTDGFPSLLRLAALLKSNPSYRATLEGHTDDIGGERQNLDLGRARAKAVADFLVANGASEKQLDTQSRGKGAPEIAPAGGDATVARWVNRRVAIRVTGQDGVAVADAPQPLAAQEVQNDIANFLDAKNAEKNMAKIVAETPAAAAPVFSDDVPAPGVHPKPLNDYVPCRFDRDDDAFFRGQKNSVVQITAEITSFEGLLFAKQDDTSKATHKKLLIGVLTQQSRQNFTATIAAAIAAGWITPLNREEKDLIMRALRGATGALSRIPPRDVGCSQSILSWEEAKDSYNRNIANKYVVYQVIVRNLNPDKEFLVEDVQIAIDNLRFVGGRDKMIARGVAMEGQANSPRNFTARLLDAISVFGGTFRAPFPHTDVANGLTIFTSGLVPGFKSVLPDRSIEQLNRFNDTSFSASSSSKIVVPKNGSAVFVTYLPAKIFADRYRYKDEAGLKAMSEGTNVIVAGAHILTTVAATPVVSSLDCGSGKPHLDPATAKDGVVTCKVKGTDLQAVTGLHLDSDANDAALDGKFAADKDGSGGTATFAAAQINLLESTKLAVAYSVNGALGTTELQADVAPTVSAVKPASFQAGAADCTVAAGCAFTLTGTVLNAITGVGLGTSASDAQPVAPALLTKSSDGTTRGGSFTLAGIKGLTAGITYTLMIEVDGKWQDSKQSIAIQK